MANSSGLFTIILGFVAVIISLTVHEFAHGKVAEYLGDPTAKNAGRLTLNPLAHIDPFGTILLPIILVALTGFGFGYAKPVPINPNNFKNWRWGEAMTSLAGPMANLFLILLFTLIIKVVPYKPGADVFFLFIFMMIQINIVLMVFNLIPIPPLDGSKVLYSFLPDSFPIAQFEMYGPFILIPFIFFFGSYIFTPIINFFINLLAINPLILANILR